jgi:NitT/TauT family transport system ATP-binding protein
MEPRKSKIAVHKVGRSFVSADGGKVDALENINFEIEDAYSREGRDIGEFRVLLGPSGCGKSTLLRLIAGLDQADTGEVLVNDRPVHGPGKDRGMVFQKYTSFPWLTVADNIAYGMKINGVPEAKRKETVAQLVEDIGLTGFENAYPETLSGGMQQRVAIARTLALRPAVILMDEPFGALDAMTRQTLQDEILQLVADKHIATVFITHDLEEAIYLGDRVVVLGGSPASAVESMEIDLPRPRTQLTTREDSRFLAYRHRLFEFLMHERSPLAPQRKGQD